MPCKWSHTVRLIGLLHSCTNHRVQRLSNVFRGGMGILYSDCHGRFQMASQLDTDARYLGGLLPALDEFIPFSLAANFIRMDAFALRRRRNLAELRTWHHGDPTAESRSFYSWTMLSKQVVSLARTNSWTLVASCALSPPARAAAGVTAGTPPGPRRALPPQAAAQK